MKTYIYTFFTILAFSFATNHLNAQAIFVGTWEHQSGNEIFRVILQSSLDGNQIRGHYEKVVVNNGIETFIYCSDKEKFQVRNTGWLPYVIRTTGNNQSIGGSFTDNTVDQSLYHPLKHGHITLDILSNSGGFNPTLTMRWFVERKSYAGLKTTSQAPNFSVPTNIILTKVN